MAKTVGIALSEELLEQIDERAKALCISRSAYISMALSQKMQADDLANNLPSLLAEFKAYREQNGKSE